MAKNKLVIVGLLVLTGIFFGVRFTTQRYVQETPVSEQQPKGAAGQETVESKPVHDNELETKITNWSKVRPGVFAVTVREIDAPQRYASYRGNEQMVSASTYKLFLTYAILHEVQLGRFTLQTPVAGGTIVSCIELLLEVSSDACAYDMGNLIGWDAVDGFIAANGFAGTRLNNYTSEGGFSKEDKVTTANDQAELVWRLATGQLLDEAHTSLMLNIMKRQIWRERIAAGVPEGIEVASKPGFIYGIQNDTGIVYGKETTYVVSLLSDGSSPNALADLSAVIYKHLNP